MRIAYITISFPNLSEQFMRREVVALRDRGHTVAVFTMRNVDGPAGQPVEGIEVFRWNERQAKLWAPDVLYGSLATPSHKQTVSLSHRLKVPFVLRIWSGLDTFQYVDPKFYRMATRLPACAGVLVEDAFMAQYVESAMAVDPSKLTLVPNSLDLEAFVPQARPSEGYVLGVGRFVEKKGFLNLVRAMSRVNRELRLVGYGGQESHLRKEAGPMTVFMGKRPMAELPEIYAGAAVCVFPCVRTALGDADGIPTTCLEAMAMGRPVIASDLLSAPCYIQSGYTGMLVPPGNVPALREAIRTVLRSPYETEKLGVRARAWVLEHLDMRRNIIDIEGVLHAATLTPVG